MLLYSSQCAKYPWVSECGECARAHAIEETVLGETCSASDSVEVLCLSRCSLPMRTNLTDLTALNNY